MSEPVHITVDGVAVEAVKGELVIDMVIPDYYARYPKPCAGGWGRVAINVSPSRKALPCHAARNAEPYS